jgi:hypothetical protein
VIWFFEILRYPSEEFIYTPQFSDSRAGTEHSQREKTLKIISKKSGFDDIIHHSDSISCIKRNDMKKRYLNVDIIVHELDNDEIVLKCPAIDGSVLYLFIKKENTRRKEEIERMHQKSLNN